MLRNVFKKREKRVFVVMLCSENACGPGYVVRWVGHEHFQDFHKYFVLNPIFRILILKRSRDCNSKWGFMSTRRSWGHRRIWGRRHYHRWSGIAAGREVCGKWLCTPPWTHLLPKSGVPQQPQIHLWIQKVLMDMDGQKLSKKFTGPQR